MNRLILAALVAIVGCGSDPSHESPTPAPAQTVAPAATVETHHSMAVADQASLPDCTADAEGWLVYVKDDKSFRACEAGTWAQIDLPTPDAPSLPSNQFVDSTTGSTWYIGGISSKLTLSTYCSSGRIPTKDEIISMIPNAPVGLLGLNYIWASDGVTMVKANTGQSKSASEVGEYGQVLCVKVKP